MSTETSSRNIAAESITNWTLAPIAHGGWGEVFKASYNDAVVAVKQPFRGHSDAELVEFRKEIAIWRRLNHRHVLPLFGACDNNSKHCIVSPFMPNGTLHDYVRDPANIRPLEEKLCLLRQVALGMAYLHSNNVVHGDLKPMNVLLDASFSAVISDFGLSHIWTDSAQTNNQQGVSVCGTPGFMAPELLGSNHEAQTTKRSDVFAFAITILTVLNNAATPWVLSSQSMGGYTVCNYVLEGGRPSRFEGIPDDVWQLVSDCWKQDPNDRPEFPSIVESLDRYKDYIRPTPEPSSSEVVSDSSEVVSDSSSCSGASTASGSPKTSDLASMELPENCNIPPSLALRFQSGDPDAALDVAESSIKPLEMPQGLAKFVAKYITHSQPSQPDNTTAVQIFSRMADEGNLEAHFYLGWMYMTGCGVQQDFSKSFTHWTKVHKESGDPALEPMASHMLGWLYYLGRGTGKDTITGIKMIKEGSASHFGLGEEACLSGFTLSSSRATAAKKFFELCHTLSEYDWLCKHLMAVCYVNGFGTLQDKTQAFTIFKELAKQGHSDSQYWLGHCYSYCLGTSRARFKALSWYNKSVNQENPYAMRALGDCYYYGLGVARSMPTASLWYMRSANLGVSGAVSAMATMISMIGLYLQFMR